MTAKFCSSSHNIGRFDDINPDSQDDNLNRDSSTGMISGYARD